MPSFAPSAGLGTLNVALSQFMKAFPTTGLIASLLAPDVPVTERSFQYLKFGREGSRNVSQIRVPGARPSQIRMSYSVDTFSVKEYALEAEVTREAGENAALLNFDLKQGATARVTQGLQLGREIRTAALFQTGITNSEAYTTGTSQWDDYAGASHPILDIAEAKYIVRKSGVEATVCALGPDVLKALTNHPDLIERFKYTNPTGNLSLEQISSALGIKCIEAGAVVTDGNDVPSFVWQKMAVLAHVEPVSTQMDLSAAKTFMYVGYGVDGYQVLDYPDPYLSTQKDWISGSMCYDLKLTAQETVNVFTNLVAES